MPEQTHIPGTYSSHRDVPSDPATLRTLIGECLAGKRAAQRILYETYAPAAWNMVKRYIFHDEPAQEVLNDVFYKVFTRLEQYNGQGAFPAWIRRITVNTVTDHLRKYIPKEQAVRSMELNEDDVYVDSDAVSNMAFRELVSFTYQLPDMHRAVFNLSVFENMTHKQIGLALDISDGNSRWILNDARKKLKQIIMTHMK